MDFTEEKKPWLKKHINHLKDISGIREYEEQLIISHTTDYLWTRKGEGNYGYDILMGCVNSSLYEPLFSLFWN